jgi:hypothetical protein
MVSGLGAPPNTVELSGKTTTSLGTTHVRTWKSSVLLIIQQSLNLTYSVGILINVSKQLPNDTAYMNWLQVVARRNSRWV